MPMVHAGLPGGILYKLNAVAREAGGLPIIAQDLSVLWERNASPPRRTGAARHKAGAAASLIAFGRAP